MISLREMHHRDEDLEERRHRSLVHPGRLEPHRRPRPTDDVVIGGGEAELLSGDAIKVASITLTGVPGGVLAIQDPGKIQSVSGNVSISQAGSLQLDGVNIGGAGGSSMTIGGSLTNGGGDVNGVAIGNTGITSADTLTVKGTGGLANASNGEINIVGSASVQATLNVANAAAGFGMAGVESGTVFLENDALLEFKSGQITTIGGTLQLNGAKARVADAGATGGNSALAGLTSVGVGGFSANFYLQNGAKVTTTDNLTVNGGTKLELDGTDTGGSGGSALTIGGSLTNGGYVSIGNTGITSADTLTVKGTGGLSNGAYFIEGGGSIQATLDAANAAAGFSTSGTLTGEVYLQNDALLEFKSGQITTLEDCTLTLDGAEWPESPVCCPSRSTWNLRGPSESCRWRKAPARYERSSKDRTRQPGRRTRPERRLEGDMKRALQASTADRARLAVRVVRRRQIERPGALRAAAGAEDAIRFDDAGGHRVRQKRVRLRERGLSSRYGDVAVDSGMRHAEGVVGEIPR
jgi:hypothetical protein